MRKLLVALLAILALSVAGVAYADDTAANSWKITVPATGANVTGPNVSLTVDPGQIKVAKPGAVVAGEGHWHFFLDGAEVGKGPTNTFEFKGLTAGKHTLGVELHQGDHSPYPGAKAQEITVNVALPNTGANVTLYAIAGVLLLGTGALLIGRKRATA